MGVTFFEIGKKIFGDCDKNVYHILWRTISFFYSVTVEYKFIESDLQFH